jgi:integrase
MPKTDQKPALPGIKIVAKTLADGTEKSFFYHRATKLALGSDRRRAIARAAEIEAIAGPAPRMRQAGSIADIIVKFKVSPEFAGLAKSTKSLWLPFLTDLEERVGDFAPRMLTLSLASKFKGKLIARHGSGSARNRFKCYSRLWNWAIKNGHTEVTNPFSAPGSFATGKSGKKKKPIWREDDITALLSAKREVNVGGNPKLAKTTFTRTEALPDDLRLGVLLAMFTLQRRGDVLSLTGKNIYVDNSGRWWMSLTQSKTGTDVEFPIHQILRAELERQDVKPGQDGFVVQTQSKERFDERNFSRKLRTWLRASGIVHLNLQAMRRSGMVWLAEAGVSTPRIAALSGHSIAVTQKILDEYIVKTRKLAAGAVDAFEDFTRGAFPAGIR